MDYLEKHYAELEAKRAFLAAREPEQKPRTDMPNSLYPVTIIGCIRGVDGWYQAGYDERKHAIVPLSGRAQQ